MRKSEATHEQCATSKLILPALSKPGRAGQSPLTKWAHGRGASWKEITIVYSAGTRRIDMGSRETHLAAVVLPQLMSEGLHRTFCWPCCCWCGACISEIMLQRRLLRHRHKGAVLMPESIDVCCVASLGDLSIWAHVSRCASVQLHRRSQQPCRPAGKLVRRCVRSQHDG